MSKHSLTHEKHCKACQRPLTWAKVAYDPETLNPYCNHTYGCNLDKRPKGLITDLDPYKIAYSTPFPTDVQETIERMLPKSHSFRISPTQLVYLMRYALNHNLTNVNQAMQHIITTMMQTTPVNYPLDRTPFTVKEKRPPVTKKDMLQEELEYYKEASKRLMSPNSEAEEETPVPTPKPKEEKKNVAFRL